MKSIATILHHKTLPLSIIDSNNNELYYEYSDRCWAKQQFDSNNHKTYYEYSDGFWEELI